MSPIPDFVSRTGYLPPGEHPASLADIEQRFAINTRRRELYTQLCYVVKELCDRGVSNIWIGGSYVTDRERPSDVDVIYDTPEGMKTAGWGELAPAQREQLKRQRRVDLWRMPSPQPGKKAVLPFISIKDYFASDLDDRPKGLIVLEEESPNDQ